MPSLPPVWTILYGDIFPHVSRRHSPVPLVSCPDLLLIVLDRDDEEHEQGDALNPCQEEEVVVQMAVVDVTWRNRNEGTVRRRRRSSLCEGKSESCSFSFLFFFGFADFFFIKKKNSTQVHFASKRVTLL